MSVKPDNFMVWSEIPVTDMARAISFYQDVFKVVLAEDTSGPNPMAMFPTADGKGVAGNLYPGEPAGNGTGPTVHFASPDKLEDALGRVEKAGGKVVSEVMEIPDGRFAYCHDPDGNSIGIFTYGKG